jgi:pantoate--beta-alanine ligase
MIIIDSPQQLIKVLAKMPRPLCLVPTMGALHEGHIALIRKARQAVGECGTVIVSIFVNPIQFDKEDDLAKYPRALESDVVICEKAGAEIIFTPEVVTMYESDSSITISENRLSTLLCGASRPGHFNGVCTVVMKLFMLSRADIAIFGKKDFQQLAVIKRMVRNLNIPIEIIGHETIREHDGLAMSSRNTRLTQDHRTDSSIIYRSLNAAAELLKLGERISEPILLAARKYLLGSQYVKIDYLEIVDAENLERVAIIRKPSILAVAVFYDNVRLIDHVELKP